MLDTGTRINKKTSIFNDDARTIILNNRKYIRLDTLGKGGSSHVHRIIAVNDGGIYAYKKINTDDFENSDVLLESYLNEINLLNQLKGSPHIIELIDYEINRKDHYIALRLEVGDIDLAKMLLQKQQSRNQTNLQKNLQKKELDNNPLLETFFARMIWSEMLSAVNHIHNHRIVHGDLKPANFVLVRGHVKLIDFGIAKSMNNDTTNIYRDSQVGTVNYMAPEAVCPHSPQESVDSKGNNSGSMKLGRASDVWSLGCILYQIIYGYPPFSKLNMMQKLSAIASPDFKIHYPETSELDAVDSIQACLQYLPINRAAISCTHGHNVTNKVPLLNRHYLNLVVKPEINGAMEDVKSRDSGNDQLTDPHLQRVESSENYQILWKKLEISLQNAIKDPETLKSLTSNSINKIADDILKAIGIDINNQNMNPNVASKSETISRLSLTPSNGDKATKLSQKKLEAVFENPKSNISMKKEQHKEASEVSKPSIKQNLSKIEYKKGESYWNAEEEDQSIVVKQNLEISKFLSDEGNVEEENDHADGSFDITRGVTNYF